MITISSPNHALHAPQTEFFRGERVPCFESPSRLDFVLAELAVRGHEMRTPDTDSMEVLQKVHSAPYLTFLQTAWQQWLAVSPGNTGLQPFPSVWPIRTLRHDIEPNNFIAKLGLYSMDNGTPLAAGTWDAVKAGADTAATAAVLVSRGERSVFCATRPPGHHAGADFMGGYCFLNNAAVATETLLASGCKRVAVLDVDYHHGNGTQSIFYQRSDVLFVSIHGDPKTEYPFYLGHADESGAGEGSGFNLNLPLTAGATTERWFSAFESACRRVDLHRADALVVSLGLDTFAGDPISTFTLQSEDFLKLGSLLGDLGLPTVLILEGGYAAKELGVNAANALDGFDRALNGS